MTPRTAIAAVLLVALGIVVIGTPLLRIVRPTDTVRFDLASISLWIPTAWATHTLSGPGPTPWIVDWSTEPLAPVGSDPDALPSRVLPDGAAFVRYAFLAGTERGVRDIPAGATTEPLYLLAPYPVPILGAETALVRETPGPCGAMGAEVTLSAWLPNEGSTAPDAAAEWIMGCFGGSATAAAEARFREVVLASDNGIGDRAAPVAFQALLVGLVVWIVQRRKVRIPGVEPMRQDP